MVLWQILKMNNALYSIRHWLVCLWIVAFIAFHLPWTSHKTAVFTLNAFDMAEQVRFHPAIVAESPTYRSSIFLWMAVPLTAGGVAFTAALYRNQWARYLLWTLALLFALRMNPPKDGLQRIFEDDYAQAFAVLT